jgi:hypothetical protein
MKIKFDNSPIIQSEPLLKFLKTWWPVVLPIFVAACAIDKPEIKSSAPVSPPSVLSKYVNKFPDNAISVSHYAVVNCDLNRPKDCDLSTASTISYIKTQEGDNLIKIGSGKSNLNTIAWMTTKLNRLKISCNAPDSENNINTDCFDNSLSTYPGEPENNPRKPDLINAIVNKRGYHFNDPKKNARD